MKKKLFLGLLAAATVSFTACQKDEVISEMPQDNAIGFGTYVGRDAQTKATVTDLNAMKHEDYSGFGVFAYYTGNDNYPVNNTTIAPAFMNNVKVWYDTDLNPDAWKYNDLKYWPGLTNQYKISFFAYAPHNGSGITELTLPTTNGDPTLKFTTPSDVATQYDLLYATPVKNTYYNDNTNITDGTVKFTFNHALTRIGFKVKTAREDYRVNISSIKLTGDFNTAGTLNLNTGAWSVTEEANTDIYQLNFNPVATVSNTTGTAINANEGYVMTIPTDFTLSNLSVSVTYTYEYEVSTGVWAAAVNDTKEGNVAVNFQQGQAYTLLMELDPLTPITFDVTVVTGWNPAEGTDTPVN